MSRGLVIALGLSTSLGLMACLGFGSPVDESGDLGARLPQRSEGVDGAIVDDPAPPSGNTSIPDSGAGATDAEAGGDAAKKPLRVFVSSALKTGNLGGVAAADQLCTTLATAAGLGGTYRAWLSVTGADAIDHITSAGPWQLVTGQVVADDKAGLTSGQLKHLIDKDEKGQTPPDAEDRVWTATGTNGRYVGPDCAQWTGGSGGLVGEAKNALASKWTALASELCSDVNRVYCFEQ